MKISSVEEGDNFFLNAHMAKHTQNPSITPSSSSLPPTPKHTHTTARTEESMRVNVQMVTLRSCLHLAQLLITQDVSICRDAYRSVQIMHKASISWVGN